MTGLVRRGAYFVLVVAVRGRRDQGGPWGEAVLGEFAMTHGARESVRWAAGGLRTVWHEHRAKVRELPRYDRLARRIAVAGAFGLTGLFLLNQFVVSSRYVWSEAMAPTLQISDRYLIDKASFHVTGIHRGDDGSAVDEPYLPSGATTDCDTVTVGSGQLYVLGDNRAVSADSREFGTVAASSVDARLLTRFYPLTR